MKRFVSLAVGMVLLAASPVVPSEPGIDINQLVSETQRATSAVDRLAMVWWMPEEFFKASMMQDGSMTPEGVEEFVGVLRPYLVIAAVDGTLGPMGGATFVDAAVVRESITLVAENGERFVPLDLKSVSADARTFATMLKPVLSGMLGAMGENMQLFFFPAVTADGDRIGDASSPGSFSIEMGEEVFEFDLPLGSVLPVKVCPVDGKEMSGAWKFCPWHGAQLEVGAP